MAENDIFVGNLILECSRSLLNDLDRSSSLSNFEIITIIKNNYLKF